MDPNERRERLEKVALALESLAAEAAALDAGVLVQRLGEAIEEAQHELGLPPEEDEAEWPD